MALITSASLVTGGNATDLSSYATTSITPGVSRLVLAAITSIFGGVPNAPTLSGNSLTWVQVATIEHSAADLRLTVFRAMGAAPTGSVVTIDFAGQVQLACNWSIVQFDGINKGGTDGSAAIIQSVTNEVTDSGSLTVTLAAFASALNAAYGAFSWNVNEVATAGVGWTVLHDTGASGGGHRVFTEWRSDGNDLTVDSSSATATAERLGIAIEIAAAAATVVPPPQEGWV